MPTRPSLQFRKPSLQFLSCLALAGVAFATTGCSGWCPRSVHAASYISAAGSVNIHQMGGDIKVPDAPDGADLATMGGNIEVGNVASFAKLHTMGGDIAVKHATGSVDASTMGGKITVRDAAGPVKASTMAGDVTVHITSASGAQQDITLSSMSGTIELTIPKNFGMDVRIKLGYTKNHEQPRIVQHLGLQESQSGDWDSHLGTPRKYIYAKGRVGDGRNHVSIDTINGTCLTLLGIGTTTALSAAAIQGRRKDYRKTLADVLGRTPQEMLKLRLSEIERMIGEKRKELADKQAALGKKGSDRAVLEQFAEDEELLEKEATKIASFHSGNWKWFSSSWLADWDYRFRLGFKDLLSENPGSSTYDFHRFQMLAWTLVLGFIFVAKVFAEKTMPQFDSNLLLLMGISSGAYIGFKVATPPEDDKKNSGQQSSPSPQPEKKDE